MARPDQNFQNFGQYVRIEFPNFVRICSDQSRHSRKKSNFVRIAHQAPKKTKYVRIGQSGLKKIAFLPTTTTRSLLSTHPISISCQCPTSTLLASCYNSFDRHQYFLKFPPQLIENLEMLVIKGEYSVILAECGCCNQGAKE